MVGGDDFTVRGGSADATIKGKHHQCEQMAHELRLPLIRLVEGSGGGGSVKTIETTGRANVPGVVGLGVGRRQHRRPIPRVALGLGSVAGLGAAHLAAAHYSVMVKDISALFVAGPPVVARLGQKLTKNELGGWQIQLKAGAVDDAVDTEEDAFALRAALPLLPALVDLRAAAARPADRRSRAPRGVARRRDPARHRASRTRCARSSRRWSTTGRSSRSAPLYGRSIITGLARLDGWPVALMASDPYFYGGAWTADTCQKVERFVDIAQTFHLPVVYLVDCPGFLIGLEAEQTGTIKQGVRAMSAIWQTTIPWCAVIVRNVFGVAGAAHKNGGRYCPRYAWPSGRWGSLPLEGGIEAAYRADLDAAPDPEAKLARDRGAAEQAPLALPLGGDLLDRGDRRPARHAAAPLRVRQPGRAAARARAPPPTACGPERMGGSGHPPAPRRSGATAPPPWRPSHKLWAAPHPALAGGLEIPYTPSIRPRWRPTRCPSTWTCTTGSPI